MKERVEIVRGEYRDVEYRMFDPPPALRRAMKIAGWASLPFLLPLIALSKLSPETGFKLASEILSLLPTALGVPVRYEFYRRTLRSCGRNVLVYAGAVFYYPEVSIGDNVMIDSHVRIHHCDVGSNVMISAGSQLLSGSRYHRFDRTDVPIVRQGGRMKRIRIGSDVWIGVNSVIMSDVGDGAVVGAGSVVTKDVAPFTVVAGNPARVIRMRK